MSDILDSDDLKMLTDIGFIATSRGLADHANAIFDAVKALRPEAEAGFLGLGMVQILTGNPAAAVKILKDAPGTAGVRAFLGIAHVQSADVAEGKKVLQSVIASDPNTPFAKIAEQTLETLSVPEKA